MRIVIVLVFVIVLSHQLIGQDKNRFKNIQGIIQEDAAFFEAEGYDIFIQHVDHGLDEKGIAAIRKMYSLEKGELGFDSATNLTLLTEIQQTNGVPMHTVYYLRLNRENRSTVIGFTIAKTRDIGLEREFVKTYLAKSIPDFVFSPLAIDSIDFAGRTLRLGPTCEWQRPHNVQCPDRGQMNWAIFDNREKAEAYRDTRAALTKNKDLVNVKEEKWIRLKFEGQETKALRTKIRIQIPELIKTGSNILIIYYVTAFVRGKYVTCILSHYSDDAGKNKLPLLLSEVLELIE
jgi:hypothetical protein